MASSASQAPHLIGLSPELRNEICSYTLTTNDDDEVWLIDSDNKTSTPPPILQVCRRIRLEASAMDYSNIHFGLWSSHNGDDTSFTKPLLAWLQSVPSQY